MMYHSGTKFVLVLLFLVANLSCTLSTDKDRNLNAEVFRKVFINPDLSIAPYLDHPLDSQLSGPENLEKQLGITWSTAFEVSKPGEGASQSVSNCDSAFKAESLAMEPIRPFEFNAYRSVVTLCRALKIASRLQTSTQSFVDKNFYLDKSQLEKLPMDFALHISDAEWQRIRQNPAIKYWSDVERIISVTRSAPEQVMIQVEGVVHEFTILARGDINRDGIEDVLIRLISSVQSGSYVTTRLFVLTRIAPDQEFGILNIENRAE